MMLPLFEERRGGRKLRRSQGDELFYYFFSFKTRRSEVLTRGPHRNERLRVTLSPRLLPPLRSASPPPSPLLLSPDQSPSIKAAFCSQGLHGVGGLCHLLHLLWISGRRCRGYLNEYKKNKSFHVKSRSSG